MLIFDHHRSAVGFNLVVFEPGKSVAVKNFTDLGFRLQRVFLIFLLFDEILKLRIFVSITVQPRNKKIN